jgi:2-keto-4-pentenoate hydratase/2-oxohepta-3-ene-1,7-dioic acid hydratase in catechol pathway
MRIARIAVEGQVTFAAVDFSRSELPTFLELKGHPFAKPVLSGRSWEFGTVRLLAPVLPSKVVAVAKNYAEHAAEMGGTAPAEPIIFLKPSTSVIGPGDVITLPSQSQRVDYEAELAVVIGRLGKDVPTENAGDFILGYTCANDVTARDLQEPGGQWTRSKGFDTFCPIGPWIDTDVSLTPDEFGVVDDLSIECIVEGKVRQQGQTSQMIHKVNDLVAWISSVMTLLPGDVILTGTPAGVGLLQNGDQVQVKISGIGTLTNLVH